MKNLVFWSTNPATRRAQIYLQIRRVFPMIPARLVFDFVCMVQG